MFARLCYPLEYPGECFFFEQSSDPRTTDFDDAPSDFRLVSHPASMPNDHNDDTLKFVGLSQGLSTRAWLDGTQGSAYYFGVKERSLLS